MLHKSCLEYWTIEYLFFKRSYYDIYFILWNIIRIVNILISHHDNIKCIGLLSTYYLITPRVSFPSVVLISFAFSDIKWSMMIMISTPLGKNILKFCIFLFLNSKWTSNTYWIGSDVLHKFYISIFSSRQ